MRYVYVNTKLSFSGDFTLDYYDNEFSVAWGAISLCVNTELSFSGDLAIENIIRLISLSKREKIFEMYILYTRRRWALSLAEHVQWALTFGWRWYKSPIYVHEFMPWLFHFFKLISYFTITKLKLAL